MRGNRCLVRVLPALPLLSAAFLIMYLSVTPCFVTYICTDGHVHRCVYIYNTYIYIYIMYIASCIVSGGRRQKVSCDLSENCESESAASNLYLL